MFKVSDNILFTTLKNTLSNQSRSYLLGYIDSIIHGKNEKGVEEGYSYTEGYNDGMKFAGYEMQKYEQYNKGYIHGIGNYTRSLNEEDDCPYNKGYKEGKKQHDIIASEIKKKEAYFKGYKRVMELYFGDKNFYAGLYNPDDEDYKNFDDGYNAGIKDLKDLLFNNTDNKIYNNKGEELNIHELQKAYINIMYRKGYIDGCEYQNMDSNFKNEDAYRSGFKKSSEMFKNIDFSHGLNDGYKLNAGEINENLNEDYKNGFKIAYEYKKGINDEYLLYETDLGYAHGANNTETMNKNDFIHKNEYEKYLSKYNKGRKYYQNIDYYYGYLDRIADGWICGGNYSGYYFNEDEYDKGMEEADEDRCILRNLDFIKIKENYIEGFNEDLMISSYNSIKERYLDSAFSSRLHEKGFLEGYYDRRKIYTKKFYSEGLNDRLSIFSSDRIDKKNYISPEEYPGYEEGYYKQDDIIKLRNYMIGFEGGIKNRFDSNSIFYDEEEVNFHNIRYLDANNNYIGYKDGYDLGYEIGKKMEYKELYSAFQEGFTSMEIEWIVEPKYHNKDEIMSIMNAVDVEKGIEYAYKKGLSDGLNGRDNESYMYLNQNKKLSNYNKGYEEGLGKYTLEKNIQHNAEIENFKNNILPIVIIVGIILLIIIFAN